jgi:hypothetical protein
MSATAAHRRAPTWWDSIRPSVASPWFVFAVGLPLALTMSALDLTGVLRGGGDAAGGTRYIILVAFIVPLIVYLDFDRRRLLRFPRPAHILLTALFLYGIVGTIVGKLFVGTATSFLPVFVPMSIALLTILVPTGPSRGQARMLLMAVAGASLLYLVMHVVSLTPLGDGFARHTYHHEKSFYLPLALASTWYLRWWIPFVIALLASAVILVDNPAATYVAVVVAVIGTAILCSRRIAPAAGAALCALVLLVAGTLYVNIDAATEVASDYFAAVGKTDNTPMRRIVLDEAFARISQDPLYAEHFAGEMAIGARFSGRFSYVPVHNDYLQLTTGGGVVALLLFSGWAVAVNYDTLRRLKALEAVDQRDTAVLLRTLLIALNTFLVTAAVNPILTQVHLGTIMFGIAAILYTLDAPVRIEDRALR